MEIILILSAPLWPVALVTLAERFGLVGRFSPREQPMIQHWDEDPDEIAGYTLEEEPDIMDIANHAAVRAENARLRAARLGLHQND